MEFRIRPFRDSDIADINEGVLFEVIELAHRNASRRAGLGEQAADVVDVVLPDFEAALNGAEGHLRRRFMVNAEQQRRFHDSL